MKIKKKLSGRGLVIQLCSKELRIASMTLGSTPKTRASVTVPLPEGVVEDGIILDREALGAVLKPLLREQGFRGIKNAVFTLCSSQVLSETAAVRGIKNRRGSVASDDKMLEKMLDANRDIYFPVDTSDSRLVWTHIGYTEDTGDGTARTVQLWAAPKSLVDEYYLLANACGLRVLAVDYCGNSFTSLVRAGYAAPAPSAHGKKAKKAKPAKASASRNGGESGGVAVEAPPQDEPEATVLYLLPEDDFLLMTFVRSRQVVQQRMLTWSGPYADELEDARMVVDLYETEHSDGGAILVAVCGACTEDPEYVTRVEEVLGLPAAAQTGALGGPWGLCIGAASTRLDFGDPALNFPGRPNLFQKSWQYGLLAAGGAVLAVAVMRLVSASTTWDSSINKKENERNSLQLMLAPISGFRQNWLDYEQYYGLYAADWQTLLGTEVDGVVLPGALRTYNDNLSLILNELERILPEGVSVTEIGISGEGLGLQIACENKQLAAYVIMTLRNLQYGKEPTYISDLTIGPGVSAFSVLSSLAQAMGAAEAPPTSGSSGDFIGVFDGSGLSQSDQDALIDIAGKAAAGETISDREAENVKTILEGVKPDSRRIAIARALCAGVSTNRYTLQQLLDTSSTLEKLASFDRLLDNPFALYLFAELVQDDLDLGEKSTMEKWLTDFAWGNINDLLKLFPDESDRSKLQKKDYSPVWKLDMTNLHDLLERFVRYQVWSEETKSYEYVVLPLSINLVKNDAALSRVYAHYICVQRKLPLSDDEANDKHDAETGFVIDPLTGLLVVPDPEGGDSGLLYDPVHQLYVDRLSNEYILEDLGEGDGSLYDLRTGFYIDRKTKRLYDPSTGDYVDPATDMRMAVFTWPLTTLLEKDGLNIADLDWDKIDWTDIVWRTMAWNGEGEDNEVVRALRVQAMIQLKGNSVDLGIHVDPNTGNLVDKDGKPVNPLEDPRLSQFMDLLPLLQKLNPDLDTSSIDWTKVDWRNFPWENPSDLSTVLPWAMDQMKNQTGGNTPGPGGLIPGIGDNFTVDPSTGQLLDKNGKPVDPTTDPLLKPFLKLLPEIPGFDPESIDWTKVDWRDFPEDPTDTDALSSWALKQLLSQGGQIPSGQLPGGFVVDSETGQLKYADTGELVDPSADPQLKQMIGMLEQYLGVDLSEFDWSRIDWRGIDIENPGQEDLMNLVMQIYANLGEDPGGPGTEQPDTRIYFTVAIPYKEELIQAEMERMGLSRDDMRDKLDLEDYQ